LANLELKLFFHYAPAMNAFYSRSFSCRELVNGMHRFSLWLVYVLRLINHVFATDLKRDRLKMSKCKRWKERQHCWTCRDSGTENRITWFDDNRCTATPGSTSHK